MPDYNAAALIHQTHPALLALRKEWLPLAVGFLYYAFKRTHEVQLPHEHFLELLDEYLEHVNATLLAEKQYRQPARYYADRWGGEDDLIRVRTQEEGHVVQLSPHAERLIGWFEEMSSRRMIGTESRLRTIITQLEQLIARSTEDTEARLLQLEKERAQIDAEIRRVTETGLIDGLSDVQIREWLEHISEMASQLLRDFSMVEEHFRDIARAIQQAQLDPEARRGDILETALESDEQLEKSDEGQSFRTFYELLTHPDQRRDFDALIDAVYTTPRIAHFAANNATLQRLTSHLLDAGERVNQSNQRLAQHLRRVVDTYNVIESRRVQTLSQEIKRIVNQLGAEITTTMRRRNEFYTIEGDPSVELPLERPLFEPPEQLAPAARPHQRAEAIDLDALTALYDIFYVDEAALHDNIQRLLMSRNEVTLTEVIASYPITQGMSEVIAYLLLASKLDPQAIDRTRADTIVIETTDGHKRIVNVPHIRFRQAGRIEVEQRLPGR